MADQPFPLKPTNTITPGITRPTPPPATPGVPPSIQPPRPITPPSGIAVKETDLSHITPSPAPHIPPSASTPVRSTVRTMEQDMTLSSPTKPATITTKPTALPIPQKPISPPPAPRFSVPMPSSPRPILPSAPPSISVPPAPTGSHKSKKILWIIGAIVLIGIIVLIFALSGGSSKTEPTLTPIPSSTPEPTETPIGFEQIFHPIGTLEGPLEDSINREIIGTGEIKTFITYTPPISLPADFALAIDQSKTYVSLYGKIDGSKGRGFAYKIRDLTAAQSALSAWESTMSRDLATMLKINTQRSASTGFLGNIYQNTPIRYRNFPDALNAIDYVIIGVPTGDHFVIITNTRDHMFGIIDRTTGTVLGK